MSSAALLVDDQDNVMACSSQTVYAKSSNSEVSTMELYASYVKPHLNEAKLSFDKYLEVPLKNEETIRVSFWRSLQSTHYLVNMVLEQSKEKIQIDAVPMHQLEFRLSREN